jgi:lipopolysaccharide/colanic/teichoic acid biosynthesis glycosyltransferase
MFSIEVLIGNDLAIVVLQKFLICIKVKVSYAQYVLYNQNKKIAAMTNNAAQTPAPSRYLSSTTKRISDLTMSMIFLAGMTPLACVTALQNKLHGKPIFYSEPRYGGNQGEIKVTKIRSMDDTGHDPTNDGTPADTYKWMILARKLGIDEFPQLLHVLTGKMALFGPRILHQTEHDDLASDASLTGYPEFLHLQSQALTGLITPFALAKRFCLEVAGNENAYRVALETNYLKNASFKEDVNLMILLVGNVFAIKLNEFEIKRAFGLGDADGNPNIRVHSPNRPNISLSRTMRILLNAKMRKPISLQPL